MNASLQGKKALITGASRGIGAAIALRFAADGADVAITYSSAADKAAEVVKAIEAHGRKGVALKADSADAAAVAASVEAAAQALGGLDILVNNAGVLFITPIADFKLEDFDKTIAVNVRSVFVASQAALKHLPDGGRIINIGSCNAERMPFPGGAVYAMSKSALQGLVQGMSRDLGPRGITVNNIQPGPVDTDMNPDQGDFAKLLREQFIALKRYGKVSEIAALAALLAGPDGGYITGANLTIDGGFNA